jgi:hypothetical protein
MPTFPASSRHQAEVNNEPLTLPVGDKTYSFPVALPFRTGLTITRLREEMQAFTLATLAGHRPNPNAELLDDARESKLIRDLIGEATLAEMEADGLLWSDVERVGKTLIAWHVFDEDRALAVWTGGDEQDPPQGPATGPANSPRTSTTSGKNSRRKGRRSRGRTS